jgi:predicted DNA-binding transcriptional regulator AlpA
MAASSKLMITEAERRFPCRIKLGCGVAGWARS